MFTISRALFRLSMVTLVCIAIITQIVYNISQGAFNPGNFFSFFTIQSNIIAAVILAISAVYLLRNKKDAPVLDMLRGAATFYMLVTGVITAILLAGADLQLAIPWVDVVLHKIFPIVMLLAWFVDPPKTKIKLSHALLWMLYPIAYLLYSLIRGAIVNWYPYPFINVSESGLPTVLITSLIIAVVAVPFCLGLAYLPRVLRKK